MDRQEKKIFAEKFKALRQENPVFFLVSPNGLSSSEVTFFRKELRQVSGLMRVVKNSILKKSLDAMDAGADFIASVLSGPTAIIYGEDPVSISKVLMDFQKKHPKKFEILGGTLDAGVVTSDNIKSLSSMPSIDQLRAQLLSVLMGPATQLASLLKETQSRMPRVLNARLEKQHTEH